jgi:DNA-directed RNA polymerase specialized sigma24 family protein
VLTQGDGVKMDVSDKKIIQGIKQGGIQRERMFEALMLQTQRLLHAYLIKEFRITSKIDRSDIVIDSYLSVDKQIAAGKFRGETKLVNYLHIVVRNRALSIIKQQKNKLKPKAEDETYPNEYEDVDNDPLDDIVIEDCIQKALAEFKLKTAKQHQQLNQYLDCDSHEDWVKKHGGTVKSSKDRLYRVRKNFNTFYERFCGKRK